MVRMIFRSPRIGPPVRLWLSCDCLRPGVSSIHSPWCQNCLQDFRFCVSVKESSSILKILTKLSDSGMTQVHWGVGREFVKKPGTCGEIYQHNHRAAQFKMCSQKEKLQILMDTNCAFLCDSQQNKVPEVGWFFVAWPRFVSSAGRFSSISTRQKSFLTCHPFCSGAYFWSFTNTNQVFLLIKPSKKEKKERKTHKVSPNFWVKLSTPWTNDQME